MIDESDRGGQSSPARQDYVRRLLRRRVMHCVRRGHLYLGLFLLPWAILYGVTGFLFNHPTAFADQPTATFGRAELDGTPMANPPAPAEVAGQVVAALNARADQPGRYALVQPEMAKYAREFAFATVKADGADVSILFDATGAGGTVRSRVPTAVPPAPTENAPFAIGPRRAGGVSAPSTVDSPLFIDAPLHERVKAAVPVVLERTGFPSGEVAVTSVPDLTFQLEGHGKTWVVTYNALTGTVAGVQAGSEPAAEELSTRRFLTRLHLASGYPGSRNAKWFWAVVVDATAFVMVFWGVSGIFMWWQIKATRKLGFLILVLSITAASALGFGMHNLFAAR